MTADKGPCGKQTSQCCACCHCWPVPSLPLSLSHTLRHLKATPCETAFLGGQGVGSEKPPLWDHRPGCVPGPPPLPPATRACCPSKGLKAPSLAHRESHGHPLRQAGFGDFLGFGTQMPENLGTVLNFWPSGPQGQGQQVRWLASSWPWWRELAQQARGPPASSTL